ncbi:hypothetical protein HAX54_043854 [Datura stramonium]|uniref:Uncharacterized protein n=1 Tax=Datura stramonium TaxID=4076 RepID=A0ABS8SNN4_DATST|nr:hypothetical protein [Datura stramonium]
MGREVESKKLLLLLLTIVLLKPINVQKVACVDASQECNGTSSIGDCLPDVDEFLMDSETNAMLLVKYVKRPTLQVRQKPPICRADIYGNCIGNPKNPPTRPCNYDSRCKRGN